MKYLLLIVFSTIVIFEGCRFPDDDVNLNCRDKSDLEGVEFIVFNTSEENTRLFNSREEEVQILYLACENVDLPANLAVDSIFRVHGRFVRDCNDGNCIEIDSLTSPVCERALQIDTSIVTSIYSDWDIVELSTGSQKLYPSCSQPDISLEFDKDAAESIDYPDLAEGVVGANLLAFNFRTNADTIFLSEAVITQSIGQPYVQKVEDAIVDLLQNDTLLYRLNYNSLILKDVHNKDSILLSL